MCSMKDIDMEPIDLTVIADSIRRIDESMQAVKKSGLKQKALEILIADASGIGIRQVRQVLTSMSQLRQVYLVPEEPCASPSKKQS